MHDYCSPFTLNKGNYLPDVQSYRVPLNPLNNLPIQDSLPICCMLWLNGLLKLPAKMAIVIRTDGRNQTTALEMLMTIDLLLECAYELCNKFE